MATIAIDEKQNFDTKVFSQIKTHVQTHYLLLLGRIFFSLLFILASFGHFTQSSVDYAVAQGVPLANILVPISGVVSLIGGLSILLGFQTRIGAILLILFLVPVTLMMHNFWSLSDPMMIQMQKTHFLKNLSLLGATLFILYFGSGPLSFDSRMKNLK